MLKTIFLRPAYRRHRCVWSKRISDGLVISLQRSTLMKEKAVYKQSGIMVVSKLEWKGATPSRPVAATCYSVFKF